MLFSLSFLPTLVGLALALPQDSCVTVTTETVVPTTTVIYATTDISTVYPTTAENFGTFTYTVTLSSTSTLATLTSTSTSCVERPIYIQPETTTVYAKTSAGPRTTHPGPPWWGMRPRSDSGCTVTVTTTTYLGEVLSLVPANATSTFYDYTAFTEAYETVTTTGGTAYTIATAHATTTAACSAQRTITASALTTTVTQDPRCAPSAITSAIYGFGLEYETDVPQNGAAYVTSTKDASQCCQLCAETSDCSASAWDIRTGNCTLEFAVNQQGQLTCGVGLVALYGQGPDHPLAPGAGLYVAPLCGTVEYGAAPPDDGT